MTTREALKAMVDALPEALLPGLEEHLARLQRQASDSLWRRLDEAPRDDEPLTEREIANIERGWQSHREGRGVPDDELNRLLG